MTVLITGASAGIGEATARAFAALGANLVLGARRVEKLHALAAELSAAHGVLVTTLFLDVSDRASAESILERAGNPEVDVLVNNAGLARGLSPFQDNEPDDWDEMINANVKGLLWVTRPIVRQMIARMKSQSGARAHIVNLGSTAGIMAYPNGAVYCATKAAVKAITDGLRQDVTMYPIRVTLIQPGMVETEFSQVRFRGDEARAAAVYKGIDPLTAHDIAQLIVYAVSAPPHVQIAELTVTATHQANAFTVYRRPTT